MVHVPTVLGKDRDHGVSIDPSRSFDMWRVVVECNGEQDKY
jgi:hypothetical protein